MTYEPSTGTGVRDPPKWTPEPGSATGVADKRQTTGQLGGSRSSKSGSAKAEFLTRSSRAEIR
ncbi:hypothetical protein GCM10009779_57170 [Polymorphospora rubra]|uniref:Uncharacterized protein n=1 Tax=Polymorphospora rubra TaxID=338584 RepID=A0A810N913_9ACTN|nr:hypothetical protein Prubr_53090 [Polymorphospora rubra]